MDYKDLLLKNLNIWEEIIRKIFPISIPSSCTWKNKQDIVSVLNVVGTTANANHMFLPLGGGLDISGAAISHEQDCIELLTNGGCPYVIKPLSLTFQSFNDNYEWSYFRIETMRLNPSGVYKNSETDREEVVELTPGFYINRNAWDTGYYGYDYEKDMEKTLPNTARLIVRYMAGAFVIFSKSSPYNLSEQIFNAYSGYHNSMDSEKFKDFISQVSHLGWKEISQNSSM